MTRRVVAMGVLSLGFVLGLSACTNPYDPAQRAVGGALIGAGTGAAIGAAAGGGHGAALGAAIGAAVGLVGGVATTPPPPPPTAYAPYGPGPAYAEASGIGGDCGPYWHPVPAHWNRWGRWVPPHCAPNRRWY